MASWFGDHGGETVPQVWREALEAALGPLRSRDPELADRVLSHVVAGSDPRLPSDLGAFARANSTSNTLLITPAQAAAYTGMQLVLKGLGSIPVDVALRFARMFEGAAWPHQLQLRPFAGGRWAEALVQQLATSFGHTQYSPARIDVPVSLLEHLAVAAGGHPHEVMVAAFEQPVRRSWHTGGSYGALLIQMQGYDDAVRQHAEHLRPVILSSGIDERLVVVEQLVPLTDATLGLFASEIVDYATSSSSKVRTSTAPLVPRAFAAALPHLKSVAASGKPDARVLALRMIHDSGVGEHRAWAVERAASDRAASARALVDEWSAAAAAEAAGPDDPVVDLPTIDWGVRLSPDLRDALLALLRDLDKRIADINERVAENVRVAAAAGRPYRGDYAPTPRLDDVMHASILARLEAGEVPDLGKKFNNRNYQLQRLLMKHLPDLVAAGFGAPQLTLLMQAEGAMLVDDHERGLSHLSATLYDSLHTLSGTPTLLELSTMLDERGLDGAGLVCQSYLREFPEAVGRTWPDHDVVPFVAAHLDRFLALVDTPAGRAHWIRQEAPYTALGTLPVKPRRVVDTLFAVAVGLRKSDRQAAQAALAGVPGIEQRLVAALADGKAEVRVEAAQWLQRLGHAEAVPALEAAVAKEKQDAALGALLDALQSMGRPVEKYLNRDDLDAKARKAMEKGAPQDLAWFPWTGLPPLRWADSGEPVARPTVAWFLSQAVKTKSPEPNALLRKYAAMFDPRDREPFGQYVLEAWVSQDLTPISAETALAEARNHAHYVHSAMARNPQGFENDPLFGKTLEELTAWYLPRYRRRPVGSAAASKGLLAVAAACAGEGAAPVAQKYLKDWYGLRAAQGRALIQMLAWIDHPSATQLMLSVGSRFRTKAFQDEATRQAEALAERKGWTVAELADRTIPTAGFDERGVLELSYGERVFTAHLTPELSLELRSPEGTKISSLPAPRTSDDEEAVKASKKSLAAARKELKSVVTLQAERLYEALCTGRTWSFEDWQRYLNRHPVMRHLTRRLAWVATDADLEQTFRPLADGSLTDVDDRPVTPSDDAVVAVAHDSLLPPDQVTAWLEHFSDYEVVPLFQQLGKGTYVLPEGTGDAREIKDFVGHVLEAFSLRGQATKLGYVRGAAGDAAFFYAYEKRFPTLGITAVAGFSGNYLPEENHTVALGELSFVRSAPDGSTSSIRLDDVPPVLLSEAWNDVRVMAAAGTGFDPAWQQKVTT